MDTRMLIGGELVEGTGAALEVENPATGAVFASLAGPDEEQLEAALAKAREGAAGWSQLTAADRAELLRGVANWLREHTDELAETMTREGGKPLVENRDEVGWTASAFDFYAELGRAHAGRVIPPVEASQVALVLKEPMGVVACIVPWNYPLLLLSWKLAPALAAGNACICKPSELTPLATLALAPAFADFPPGAVQIVAGAGDVGARLTQDERVDCVAFTGSVETGKKIAHACAERVARLNLELGGKDPFIVCPDVADEIAIAARGGAWAAFLNAGQVCTSAERFYVHTDVYDAFLEEIVGHAQTLRVGDPFDPATDVGPMASAPQRQKVLDQLETAVAAGAEIITGGTTNGPGHFLVPAVVTGAPDSTALLREETFGPVAPIVRVDSLDEAIAHANGTRFGLGANIYTRDLRNVVRCMREIKAGTVWFNDPLTDNDAGPFGGFKQSGLGRELGVEGLEAFQETKHVHIESVLEIKDWWYPYNPEQ